MARLPVLAPGVIAFNVGPGLVGYRDPRAVQKTRHLRMGPRQPAPGDRRPNRDREVMVGLRIGAQGLPGGLLRALPARLQIVRGTRHRSW